MEDVLFRYEDDTLALKEVTLSIEKGEKVAILGPNGAGKSTLLKLAAGLLFPDEGCVKLFGKKLAKKNAQNLRKKVGMLFQDPDDQIFMPKVWDDVAFGPINLGYNEKEVRGLVQDALKVTGLEGFEDRVPHHLSYGEKKRVAIAGILAMKPEILLLDEPTSNLDPKGRIELMDIIKKSCETLVIATHDVNIAAQIAERGIVLNKKVVASGPIKRLFLDGEMLEQNNLDAPENTKLFLSMRESGYDLSLPLSTEDAVSELKKKLPR
ncbi:MAG: ATP-binding cassette domain-containing protein [Methanomassiliicoccales archaeon]|nr:MAG: ATP-binding cassette domain-containing protein [Methanomassiliicoccales archaeon]